MVVSVPFPLQAPIRPQEAPLSTKQEMVAYASKEAQKAKISPTEVLGTIECESGWNPTATGDRGRSHGLAQIFSPAHPNVSLAQAEDPKWSIDFMVKSFEEGHASMWTCHRELYGK